MESTIICRTKNGKKGLVVNYSKTINHLTRLDAYSTQNFQDILNKVGRNEHFKKNYIKEACHHLSVNKYDCPLTAFEATSKHF